MSLRARLLIGLVAVAAIGLGVAAVVTYEEQRSFLLTRVDQQVGDSRLPVSVALGLINRARPRRPPAITGRPERGPGTFQTSGRYGVVLGAAARCSRATRSPVDEAAVPVRRSRPHFRSRNSAPRAHACSRSRPGSGCATAPLRSRSLGGRVLVIAVPLREVDQTLQRLLVVEALVGASVILALVVLGWIVIRVGLRPLERMGRVASEIAHGNLSRRVSPANQRTEVGRLGASLNEMLVQIEQAFADRGQSEERLRRFLSDASHELRTPLASIRGYAELFRLGAANEPAGGRWSAPWRRSRRRPPGWEAWSRISDPGAPRGATGEAPARGRPP